MEVVSESSLGDVKLKAPVDPLQQTNDVDGLKVNGDMNGDEDMEVGEEDSPCNGDQAELSENGVNDEPMDESETPDLQESEQGQGSEQGSEPELDSDKEQEPDQDDDEEEAMPIKEEIEEEDMPEDMTKDNLNADEKEEEPKENDNKEEKSQVKEENVSEDKAEGDNGESTDSAPQESESQKDVIDLVTPVKDPDSREDGESTPEKTPSKKKKVQPITNVTPRRSSRNLNKTKSYIDDTEIKSEEEEAAVLPAVVETKLPNINLPPSVTLAKKNTIVVSDTKRLAEIAAGSKAAAAKGGKKEPTLVIIDTNSLLANKSQHQVSLTPTMPSRVSVVPVAAQNLFQQKVKIPTVSSPVTITPPKPQVILPSLTDDMFVVEAPSFIVPYVYEKPPINALKEYLKDLEQRVKVEADEKRKKEDEEEKERLEEEKKRKELEEPEEEEKMDVDKPKEDEKKEESEEKVDEKMNVDKDKEEEAEDESKKKEDKAKSEDSTEEIKKEDSEKIDKDEEITDKSEVKEMKENEPEEKKVTETDDKKPSEIEEKKSEKEENKSIEKEEIKYTEKEEKKPSDKEEKKPSDKEEKKPSDKEEKKADVEEKKSDAEVLEDKTNKTKSDNYFENPLGKFFMQIGINLVQEHVQADLLKNQLRKKDKEGSKCSADVHMAISALTKTLEVSKENNKPFRYELKKCQLCNFKTESQLAMAHHLETPHMKNFVYRCNFCEVEVRSPHDILFHMEAEHNVRGRLDRSPAFHQCPNCPFEDNQKGKLSRHLLSCAKKYKPERNQEPPLEWEPPAKIPRVRGARGLPLYPGGPAAGVAGSMSGGRVIPGVSTPLSRLAASQAALAAQRGRGRPPIYVQRYPPTSPSAQKLAAHIRQGGVVFRPSNQPPVLLPTTPYSLAPTLLQQAKGVSNGATAKLLQQPSISITPLPRGGSTPAAAAAAAAIATSTPKPGRPPTASATPPTKNSFVICEICDGYIKDLEQLRNHMQWIHKVKIHPKMIYNRPPLNCQKCQFRFFTDQGLERHLLGSHGLVTSSMQEAANKGKDGGRCPVCGRVYQWKLLNHVARDHSMSLKPAHLSYKCTVCTATFGMYKQFENHVYSAHSVVAKRVMDKTKPNPTSGSNSSGPPSSGQPSTSSSGDGMLKPLKINDEITIIPQPARAKTAAKPAPQATSAATVTKTPASNSTK